MKLSDVKDMNTRVTHGGWVGKLDGFPGVQLKVRGVSGAEFQRALTKAREGLAPTDDIPNEPFASALNDYVLMDWKGFDEDYSKEAALDLLKMTVFQNAVFNAGSQVAVRGTMNAEDVAKN